MRLEQAEAMVGAAMAEARSCNAKPLAVIVLDIGGHPVAFRREDGCSLFRFDIARAKALGALGMGADSAELAKRAGANPIFFTTVAIACGGNLALSPGGLLVFDQAGLVGAVGISGDTGEVDEACARAGIAAAHLRHGGMT
jgi:uncharacterized protein GlcG (DUF336 family)